jgi:Ca2+-binding RTX toxin-like protein
MSQIHNNNLRFFRPFRPQQATVSNQNGNLVLDAGAGNDNVRVSKWGNGVRVNVNGQNFFFNEQQAKNLTIKGGSGNDSVRVDSNVKNNLRVDGGSGNDYLERLPPRIGRTHSNRNPHRRWQVAPATENRIIGELHDAVRTGDRLENCQRRRGKRRLDLGTGPDSRRRTGNPAHPWFALLHRL